MVRQNTSSLIFFLGGYDLEMVTIRALIEETAADRFFDYKLSWGAKASAYAREIKDCLDQGKTPVLVELENDIMLREDEVIFVDHHGEKSGTDRPTSLDQVFDLLELPGEKWTRWFDLVAANDRGYIPELVRVGATREEIIDVRVQDRKAQGITEQDEKEGEAALSRLEEYAEGMLKVVRLHHNRTAVVTDRLALELGGPGYKNLLVICPDEIDFFGMGFLVVSLNEQFPGGWYGGTLPERGYWGHGRPIPDVLDFLLLRLSMEAGGEH